MTRPGTQVNRRRGNLWASGSAVYFSAILFSTLWMVCTNLYAFEITSLKDAPTQLDHIDDRSSQSIADRLNKLEQSHALEIERLQRRVLELEEIIRRMQRQAKNQRLMQNELAFEQSRRENWSRVVDGMLRKDVYRLLGRGIKDTKTNTGECRCYTQGRVCFDEQGYSTKTETRCQL